MYYTVCHVPIDVAFPIFDNTLDNEDWLLPSSILISFCNFISVVDAAASVSNLCPVTVILSSLVL